MTWILQETIEFISCQCRIQRRMTLKVIQKSSDLSPQVQKGFEQAKSSARRHGIEAIQSSGDPAFPNRDLGIRCLPQWVLKAEQEAKDHS